MRDLRTFLTASSLLAAVVLVWAQLWERSSQEESLKYAVGLGLSWTIMSVLLSLFAMAWAGFTSVRNQGKDGSNATPDLSIGLFGASIIMTIYNVGLSCLSIIAKTASGMDISKSMVVPAVGSDTFLLWYGLGLLIIFFMIFGFSIGFSRGNMRGWLLSIISLTLLILIVAIVRSIYDIIKTPASDLQDLKYLWFMLGLFSCSSVITICFICYLCRKMKQYL
jgi:hypothetical protein